MLYTKSDPLSRHRVSKDNYEAATGDFQVEREYYLRRCYVDYEMFENDDWLLNQSRPRLTALYVYKPTPDYSEVR